jgi:hypothetical protein
MNTASKLEVNAALWNLVKGVDILESCKTVIGYGSSLPEFGRVDFSVTKTKDSGKSFTGQTDIGNVTIPDEDEKDEKEVFEVLGKKHRIGHFKMFREDDLISFHHFWASDETTSTSYFERPETFVIAYDPKTLKFLSFGVWTQQITMNFGIISIIKGSVKTLYGDYGCTQKYRNWGFHIGF